MLNFVKKNKWVFIIFSASLALGILTFFTFINESFLKVSPFNLQTLLILDLILVVLFFAIILSEIIKLIKNTRQKKVGTQAHIRYITFFSLATLIPAVFIATFSLFMFSVGLQKYFDEKITTAVNNSYDVAKKYVDETRNAIQEDVLLVAMDVNRNVALYYDDKKRFKNLLRNQRLIRRLDEIHLIDSSGNPILSSVINPTLKYIPPQNKAFELLAAENKPIKIIDANENRSAAILKLNNYIDTYLYIVKFIDPKIINYLQETEQAINFYYNVESKQTGITITFALIYIIVVTLLLFLSIAIAIRFASRFFQPIVNLIGASESISSGNLDAKVPLIDSDEEINQLNKNFNSMIDKLKEQQEKLLLSERHEAWKNVARKLAHEIKNPLTPIQLSIDRLREKYMKEISNDKENFENYLKTINRQIKDIEHLVNEFSDFARMPKPVLKRTNIKKIIDGAINLYALSSSKINFKLKCKKEEFTIFADEEQLNRVFINLIKNSVESLEEKTKKNGEFAGKIHIEIKDENNYIYCSVEDNGIGFSDKNLNKIVEPYFTTKVKGTGLGLAIVNKIISDHNGKIYFKSTYDGAKVEVSLPKNNAG